MSDTRPPAVANHSVRTAGDGQSAGERGVPAICDHGAARQRRRGPLPEIPMPTRDVWRIHRAGSLNRLRRDTEELGAPPPGHARVAVGAVGLNFADLAACLGLYSATPKGPFVPGLEFAGTVEAVGDGVTTVASGDRVIGLTRFGGYATLDQRRHALPSAPACGLERSRGRRAAGAGDHGVVRHQRTGRLQTR